MHKCAEVHDAMIDVTGLVHRTNDQHEELGSTRCNRDVGDLNTILKWIAQHNRFDIQRPELRPLSSGLTASDGDGVNCNEVEEVGLLLQGKLDDVKHHEASMKRTEKVRTLIHLTKGIRIVQDTVHVEPLILFSRLLVLLERYKYTTPYFQYELTPFPASLFKHSLKHNEVTMQYMSYARHRYGTCSIVFDGFSSRPSLKDHEQKRRAGKASADIQISPEMNAHR